MATYDFVIKQGDNQPGFTQSITDSNGSPVNLTSCSVNLVVRTLTSSTPFINAAAEIVDAVNGQVQFNFSKTQTANAGEYIANWVVTSEGLTFTIPTIGFLSISIEENLLTPGGGQIVSLGEIKEALNIPADDRSHDVRLIQMASSITPVIEMICGPILERSVTEYYKGGHSEIILRSRPAVSITSVSEWRGPVEWVLDQVTNPTDGSQWSFLFEAPNKITRRGPGGSTFPFPASPQGVKVTYIAGRSVVPENVREGTLQLLRIHYARTQGRPLLRSWPGDGLNDEQEPSQEILGFLVPGKVRELLAPTQRTVGFF